MGWIVPEPVAGTIYNKWKLIEPAGTDKNKRILWLVECQCEKKTRDVLPVRRVMNGYSKSCGCLRSEVTKEVHTTHGMSKTPEYNSWRAIMARCYTETDSNYYRYGGVGIHTCEGIKKFEHFFAVLGLKPSKKHTADRIDNDSHYYCGACEECIRLERRCNIRWATPKVQQNNKSNNHLVKFNGKELTLSQWEEETGILGRTIGKRLKRGWTEEEALTTPSLHEAV